MGRNSKEGAIETREKILTAVEEFFFNEGVGSISCAKVAVAAGVTRGAIYWHFESEKALLMSTFARTYSRVYQRMRDAERATLNCDPRHRLEALCLGVLQELGEDVRLGRLFCMQINYAAAKNNGAFREQLRELSALIISIFTSLLTDIFAKHGQSSELPSKKAHFLLAQITGSVHAIVSSENLHEAKHVARANLLESMKCLQNP